jgi:hypothetical protein
VIENRQDPRAGDETKRNRHQYPKHDSLHVSGPVGKAVILQIATLRHEIKHPKGESKEKNRQHNEDWSVRFESSQMADPSASDSQTQK